MNSLFDQVRLRAPLAVMIELNSRCQLRCRYCSAMPFDGTEIPTQRAIDLIEELGRLRVLSLTITGGEPLLHADITEIIETAVKSGLKPNVNTNGLLLLNQTLLASLARVYHGSGRFDLTISIDSSDPAINDRSRARGQSVKEAISLAVESGIRVGISCVVQQQNIESALSLIDDFPQVERFGFFPAIPTSNGLRSRNDHALATDRADAKKFWECALRIQRERPEKRIVLPMREGAPFGEVECSGSGSCFCGFTKCHVDSHLNVYPCDWSRSTVNLLGNLAGNDLASVWTSVRASEVRELAKQGRLCDAQATLIPNVGATPVRYRT